MKTTSDRLGRLRCMQGPAVHIAGWVVASSVTVVAAAGLGCGTARAEQAEQASEGSSQGESTPSPSQQAETSDSSGERRDIKPTSSPTESAGTGADDADEETLPERGTSTPHHVRRPAPDTTVQDDPAASPAVGRRLDDAASNPAETAPAAESSPQDLEVKSAVRTPDSEKPDTTPAEPNASVDAAGSPATAAASTVPVATTDQQDSSVHESTLTPKAASAVNSLVDIAAREQKQGAVVTAAEAAAARLDAAPQKLYTGRPSLVQQVVVFVLRIVNAALSPFGGIIAFTGLKVPILADGVPPPFLTAGLDVRRDTIAGTPVYVLTPRDPTDQTVIALHGGAYVAEASLFHWQMYTDMARRTGATVIVPDYPLIGEPGGTADVVVPRTAALITQVIATNGAQNTSVLGDSAGGGLALAAVQLLVAGGAATPRRMVLLAPWLDATVSDPESARIWDPLLNRQSLIRDGELWAGRLGPSDPWASPINGSLDGLPPITVYSGSLDLLSPQSLRLRERAMAEGADITVKLREGLMHDYPIFFFLPDALAERASIYQDLLGADSTATRPAQLMSITTQRSVEE